MTWEDQLLAQILRLQARRPLLLFSSVLLLSEMDDIKVCNRHATAGFLYSRHACNRRLDHSLLQTVGASISENSPRVLANGKGFHSPRVLTNEKGTRLQPQHLRREQVLLAQLVGVWYRRLHFETCDSRVLLFETPHTTVSLFGSSSRPDPTSAWF